MTKDRNPSFIYLLFAALFSLVVAYAFGNDGYEAFVTIAIALGLLVSWQLLNLARILFQTRTWPIIKLFGILPIGFFWFVAIAAVILSISNNAFDPSVDTPPINWIVVLIGTLPFLMPRVGAYRPAAGTRNTIIGLIASLYSIMVLYVAVIGYYDSDAKYRSLILVLAVQLQYLMSYAVTKTNYLNRAHTFAVNLTRRLKISYNDFGQYLIIFIVGLPFILPLVTVLFLGTLH